LTAERLLRKERVLQEKNGNVNMWKLFKDENDINEKAIVGFASFVLMVVFAICDLITGWCGMELVINEVIYNSFVIVTLGSFGISSFEKIKGK
tara:strand:+ start:120 stop:398 length:279 start_codon:yes stop_codon:yes gene_type:complete